MADEAGRARVLAAAQDIADQQAAHRSAGEASLPGAKVLALLMANRDRQMSQEPATRRFHGSDNRVIMEMSRRRGGGVMLTLAPGAARAELEQAFSRLLDDQAPGGVLRPSPR